MITLFRRFPAKVMLMLVTAMLFMLLLSNTLIYTFSYQAQLKNLRHHLIALAKTIVLLIDSDQLMTIPLNRQGVNSPAFHEVQTILKRVKQNNPEIKYLYALTPTTRQGVWQFIVDADTIIDETKDPQLESYPGNIYEAYRFPEMMKAFNNATADKQIEIDEWGATLSGYAPIRDHQGKTVAVLGIDLDAQDVHQLSIKAQRRVALVLLIGFLFSIILAAFFSRKITAPVNQLLEGTRRLGKGDLQYRVQVKGEDEISELARSFNDMAQNLFRSRRQLLSYFLNVIRMLVRILEARDMYTKGHSQAVADYAAKIALRMGINKTDVKMFKKMVILHDIGKIGIEDRILNKPGKLTDEEMEIIKKHTVIGEGILKPVLNNKDLLAVVRGHHERYDGKGYPDQLKQDEINIYAAIVSVADAYHAMTSDRVYRKALSHAEAVEELKKNKGSQFHPKVVETFLKILEEENP